MDNGHYLRTLWRRLTPLYDAGEAHAVVRYMLEIGCSMSVADVYCMADDALSDVEKAHIESMMMRLEKGEPVQYVVGKAVFMGREYAVKPGVLIPRDETRGLCMMVEECVGTSQTSILDIGTGSGCIAITLALDLPQARLTAWDISPAALETARHNATALGADVEIVCQDMLHAPVDDSRWDVIVSNPPYVCCRERASMHRNVLDYEPAEALFVPDSDPLMFYKAIVTYAARALTAGGRLFFEINPLCSAELARLVGNAGFTDVSVKKDDYDKERYLSARLAR